METQGDGHMTTEAETGGMWLQAQEGLEHQELGERHGTASPSEAPKETNTAAILIYNVCSPEL